MEMFGWMMKAVNNNCTSFKNLGNVAGLSMDCIFSATACCDHEPLCFAAVRKVQVKSGSTFSRKRGSASCSDSLA